MRSIESALSQCGVMISEGQVVGPGDTAFTMLEIRDQLRVMGLTQDQYASLPPDKLHRATRDMRRALVGRRLAQTRDLDRQFAEMSARNSVVESPVWPEMDAALTGELRLERPQGASLHHLIDFYTERFPDNAARVEFNLFQTFVVEHDWARVLPADAVGGEFVLPFSRSAFEFRVSGVRVVIFCEQNEDEDSPRGSTIALGWRRMWCTVMWGFRYDSRGDVVVVHKDDVYGAPGHGDLLYRRLVEYLGEQVRAACIMIDAEVAESEREPVSAKLTQRRVREGLAPLRSHHVIRLHHKRAARVAQRHDGRSDRRAPRLHMRRGHWRHFQDGDSGATQYQSEVGEPRSKTWINWMVVGDPDMSFIGHIYKL